MQGAKRRPGVERRIQVSGIDIALDLGPQRLSLQTPISFSERKVDPGQAAPSLVPEATMSADQSFVSAAMLAVKAKHIDDRLIAATKLMLMRGAGHTPGRRFLLAGWAARLFAESKDPRGDAVEVLLAACVLGAIEMPRLPRALRAAVDMRLSSFLSTPRLSLPLGFHADTPELTRSFRQNRMLATDVADPSAIEALVGALHREPVLRAAYEAQRRVRSLVTNPPNRASLDAGLAALDARRGIPRGECTIFPPLVSPEAIVARALFSASDEQELQSALGPPGPHAGFYQYQWWAAAPLAAPDLTAEAARLDLGSDYRTYLELLFKVVVAFARETHVEELDEEEEAEDDDVSSVLPIYIRPALSLDPVPTHYIRRAQAYRFLKRVLSSAFGDALDHVPGGVPGWPSHRTLREELDFAADLFVGASVTAWRELGREPRHIARPDERARVFEAWRASKPADPDLATDSRMMVPVSVTPEGTVRAWIFLGWQRLRVEIGFARNPIPRVIGGASGRRIEWVFASRIVEVMRPVIVEGYVKKLLDRASFRTVCHRAKSVSKTLEAIGFYT